MFGEVVAATAHFHLAKVRLPQCTSEQPVDVSAPLWQWLYGMEVVLIPVWTCKHDGDYTFIRQCLIFR